MQRGADESWCPSFICSVPRVPLVPSRPVRADDLNDAVRVNDCESAWKFTIGEKLRLSVRQAAAMRRRFGLLASSSGRTIALLRGSCTGSYNGRVRNQPN